MPLSCCVSRRTTLIINGSLKNLFRNKSIKENWNMKKKNMFYTEISQNYKTLHWNSLCLYFLMTNINIFKPIRTVSIHFKICVFQRSHPKRVFTWYRNNFCVQHYKLWFACSFTSGTLLCVSASLLISSISSPTSSVSLNQIRATRWKNQHQSYWYNSRTFKSISNINS